MLADGSSEGFCWQGSGGVQLGSWLRCYAMGYSTRHFELNESADANKTSTSPDATDPGISPTSLGEDRQGSY